MKQKNSIKVKQIFKKVNRCFLLLWIVVGLVGVMERYFTGILVQWVISDAEKVTMGVIVLALLFFTGYIMEHFGKYVQSMMVESKMKNVRETLLSNVLWGNYRKIETVSKGELLTKLMVNLKKIQDYEEKTLPRFFMAATQGVLALGVCIWISPILALILVIMIPILILISGLSAIPSKSLIDKRNELENEQNTFAENRLENIQTIKIYSMEEDTVREYGNHLNKIYKQGIKIANLRAVLTILDGLNFIVPYILIFGGATLLALNGKLGVGEVVSFSYLMNYITGMLGSLQQFFYEKKENDTACQKVDELLEIEVEQREKRQAEGIGKGEVLLQNVSFSYRDSFSLSGINLHIKRGEKIAIVGESGSGKSTLFKLMCGIYDADCGRVLLGSDNISCINQENFLLPVSAAENIKGEREELPLSKIKEAAVKAGIASRLEELPDGYDTILDMRKLSGGEIQRICMARGYAKQADILFLDEPTSALDEDNEELLWNQIEQINPDTTVVMVTHSLRHMNLFDKIAVMSDGNLVEWGTHQELLEKEGSYFELCKIGGYAG